MIIRTDGLPWPIAPRLRHILQAATADIPAASGATVTFRDPTYDACTGGFHPVEIGLAHDGRLLYITDFAFAGRPPDTEIVKEIDFSFELNLFGHLGVDYPIMRGQELFSIWQSNFLAYFDMDAYTVSVELTG
ncbi:MAG: DUF2787 domain-containing protein [Deltaproteobacteria bacterium]|nr:MAG: DUF2787 domain-containing protein [Deltaproteobacteria bacterium]